VDYYREWAKGNSVASLLQHKLGAAADARRLKHLKSQGDERRTLLQLRRLKGDDREEFFDALGEHDVVYKKLSQKASQDVDMEDEL
jgi:hypothetical protein